MSHFPSRPSPLPFLSLNKQLLKTGGCLSAKDLEVNELDTCFWKIPVWLGRQTQQQVCLAKWDGHGDRMWGSGKVQGKNLAGWEGHVIASRHRKKGFMFLVGRVVSEGRDLSTIYQTILPAMALWHAVELSSTPKGWGILMSILSTSCQASSMLPDIARVAGVWHGALVWKSIAFAFWKWDKTFMLNSWVFLLLTFLKHFFSRSHSPREIRLIWNGINCLLCAEQACQIITLHIVCKEGCLFLSFFF